MKAINNNKRYIRKIESMGKGLVLFEISAVHKKVGQNYHLFFADNRKPPLDIAINPDDDSIEYISCFAQDEKIIIGNIRKNIINKTAKILIKNEQFDENNTSIITESTFTYIMSNSDLWIIRNGIDDDTLYTYEINEMNSIIFSGSLFCGILFKKLNKKELQEICNSKCF